MKCDVGMAARACQSALTAVLLFLFMALCACNPPIVHSGQVALCNPHLCADPGGIIDGHRHITENRNFPKPLALSGVMPALKSRATSSDP